MKQTVHSLLHHDMMSSTAQKGTIHQVTTMLTTSKNVLFPGHNHLLTTGAYDTSIAGALVTIKVSGN